MTTTETPRAVSLGGVKTALNSPDEFTAMAAFDCVPMMDDTDPGTRARRVAANCACLLACWPAKVRWPGQGRPTFDDFEVLASGRAAFRSLRNAGVSAEEIGAAASVAFGLICDAIISQSEVNKALGNSEESTAGSGA
jgi:hypothetical protein